MNRNACCASRASSARTASRSAPTRTQQAPKPKEQRTTTRQFVKEVRGELRKVVWPTKSETINYSIIVLVTLVFFTALIFCIDWVFSEFVLKLFNAK